MSGVRVFDGLRRILGLGSTGAGAGLPDLPVVARDELATLVVLEHGLPQLDWDLTLAWIDHRERDEHRRGLWVRSFAAVWLDELRDALKVDHRRWRHARVEGLGPLEGEIAPFLARAADRSIAVIEEALKPVRGARPIPAVALVAMSGQEDYISFTSHFFPEEGHWAGSGGMCIRPDERALPIIALPTHVKWNLEAALAHEMTHHALNGMKLPLFIEEGFTQMMEERVTGRANFTFTHKQRARQRERWAEVGIERYVSGDGFLSPEQDEQELAYHLSQVIVRGQLSERPKAFFAFARDCAQLGPEASAVRHLGSDLAELALRSIGLDG